MDSRLSYIRLLLLRVWLLQAACEFSSLVPPFFPFPRRAALFLHQRCHLLLVIDHGLHFLNPNQFSIKPQLNLLQTPIKLIAGGMAGGSVQGLQRGQQWLSSPNRDAGGRSSGRSLSGQTCWRDWTSPTYVWWTPTSTSTCLWSTSTSSTPASSSPSSLSSPSDSPP